jgi:aminoglycoside phosphotransferase (APT) family kinase protein
VRLGTGRDDSVLRQGLERWLGRPVDDIWRPAPGWSCETLVVERRLVVRLPPAGDGIFPAYDLGLQAAAQRAAAEAGVPVAAPVGFEPDDSYLGAPFLTMAFVDGAVPAEFTAGDRWLSGLAEHERAALWASMVDVVTDVHGVAPTALPLRVGLDAELRYWPAYLDWATDGAPPTRLADALAWCREHRPGTEPAPGLLWGDVRLGNVVFDPRTRLPLAVLDWDMVAAGPFEMDLAWFLALEQVQSDLTGTALSGFGDRGATVARAERRIGRPLADLDWYEVFALVRAGAVATRIALLLERHGRRPMFAPGEDPTCMAATRRIEGGRRGGRRG